MSKILVIEDNAEVRENLAEILELSDYDVVTAENGKAGVEKALIEKPDLILCDVMMPELDGFGVLRILEKRAATSQIPFIFLTAKAEKTDFRKGMNLGADDYITKPFDDVELLDAIEMRLKKSERIQQVFDGTNKSLSTFINEAKGEEALRALSESRELRHFSKKDLLFKEGDYPRRLFFVASGKVKAFRINDAGKEYISKVYSKGEFLGYSALLKDTPYQESATVIEDAEISFIPKEDFFTLLYNNRDFSARFVKMLANDVEEIEEKLLSLAYDSIRKRVAEALVTLFNTAKNSKQEDISILREDLAAMVGTAKESVIRTLSDFKSEGLINVKGSVIRIINLSKLKNLPN